MFLKVFSCCSLLMCFSLESVPARKSPSSDFEEYNEDNYEDYKINHLDRDSSFENNKPTLDIPDPLFLPIMQHSISMANVNFSDARIYGLGNFKTLHFDMRIPALKVNMELTADKLQIVGNYTLSTWLTATKGPFTVNLTNVCMKAVADLEITSGTKLHARDVETDIKVGDLNMDFKQTGFMGEIVQGVLNRMGSYLLSSVKPYIMLEANIRIKEEINKRLLNTLVSNNK